jgi:hypothetical protein
MSNAYESNITIQARTALEYTEFTEDYIEAELAKNISEFLSDDANFRSFYDGVVQQLRIIAERDENKKLITAIETNDKDTIFKALRKLLQDKGVYTNRPGENEKLWFENKTLPTKPNAIKLCFAFGLSSKSTPKTAGEFLFRVCKINGFNYRVADDIIFLYTLEHGKSHAYALELIKKYEERVKATGVTFNDGEETRSTQQIQAMFPDLSVINETTFMEILYQHAHDFIGYNKTAKRALQELFDKLTDTYKVGVEFINWVWQGDDDNCYYRGERESDISDCDGTDLHTYVSDGRRTDIEVYDEVVVSKFIDALIAKKKVDEKIALKNSLSTIIENWSNKTELENLKSYAADNRDATTADGKKATSKSNYYHHIFARGTFILLYFNKYYLECESYFSENDYPNTKFFHLFYDELNQALQECSYSALYPANPFDWLILKCAKLIDEDWNDEADMITVFTEVIKRLAIHN